MLLRSTLSSYIAKLVSDIIYEIINSEKELLLAAEIAGNVPAPVPATPLPVVKNIDDLTSSDGARSLVSSYVEIGVKMLANSLSFRANFWNAQPSTASRMYYQ